MRLCLRPAGHLGGRADRRHHYRDSRGGTAAVPRRADQEGVSTSAQGHVVGGFVRVPARGKPAGKTIQGQQETILVRTFNTAYI